MPTFLKSHSLKLYYIASFYNWMTLNIIVKFIFYLSQVFPILGPISGIFNLDVYQCTCPFCNKKTGNDLFCVPLGKSFLVD